MTQVSANFELGTNGNTIATGDAGSLTAWDNVIIGAGGSAQYNATNKYGTLAARLVRVGANVSLRWTTAMGSPTDHYGRFYIWPNALVNTMQYCVCNSVVGLNTAWYLQTDTVGHVTVYDATFTQRAIAGTAVLTAGAWNRLEYHAIQSVAAGQIEVKIFTDPDSATAAETIATASNINTGAQAAEIEFCAEGPNNTYWFDNIVAGAASYPGPASASPSIFYVTA